MSESNTPDEFSSDNEPLDLSDEEFSEDASPEDDVRESSESGEDKDDESKPIDPLLLDPESSDEDYPLPEALRNTVGNIPMHWYDDYDHIGYNLDGEKILKSARKDALEDFLAKADDPNYWRTIRDELNDRNIVLSDRDLMLLKRVQQRKTADKDYEYETFILPATENPIHPLNTNEANYPPKSRFIPSRFEAKKIEKLVRRIRSGRLSLKKKKKQREGPRHYDIWASEADLPPELQKFRKRHIAAPKPPQPTHFESYNPPAEYLPDDQEKKTWEELPKSERKRDFLPTKFDALRQVPRYSGLMRERFNRCLDLYLCPRAVSMKYKAKVEDLLPVLPSPEDLRPFPTTLALQYLGHEGKVNSISADAKGQYFVSGGEDCTVRVWEVDTTKATCKWTFEKPVTCVAWNPDPKFNIIAAAVGDQIIFLNPKVGSPQQMATVAAVFSQRVEKRKVSKRTVEWEVPIEKEQRQGILMKVTHEFVNRLTWHRKGDYLASVASTATRKSIMIHRVSQRMTNQPFRKTKGFVENVMFHPSKPFFFVIIQNRVFVYNLQKQELMRKLISGMENVSSMSIHKGGDNLLLGGYDNKVAWFDLDLSVRPYKTMRYHKAPVRAIKYHKKYPLFASCSDDASIHLFHGMVYDDLLKNAMIVPLKKLIGGHTKVPPVDGEGVIDIEWHPSQPWIFSAGADSLINLYM